jgi:hypothetical protein
MEYESQTVPVETPHGRVNVSVTLGSPFGDYSRLDSDDIPFVAEDIIARACPKLRNDAGSTMAFARQLEYRYKEVLEIEFSELVATELIPLDTEVPAGSTSYTYRMWNKIGNARVIANFANDLPVADVDAKEFPASIITLGASWQFSYLDVQRAALADVPLEALKAEAARFAIEYLEEQIAAAGFANAGVVGLTNAPGLPSTAQVSTGGTWLAQIAAVGAATAAEPAAAVAAVQGIASDINAMVAKIYVNTKGLYYPDTCALPTNLFIGLKQLPRSPAFTGDNAMTYLETMTGCKFVHWPQLNTLGSTSLGRVVVYKRDKKCLRLIQAQPFTQLPPQPKNLAFIVPCLSQIGGVNYMRPLTGTYMDGLAG